MTPATGGDGTTDVPGDSCVSISTPSNEGTTDIPGKSSGLSIDILGNIICVSFDTEPKTKWTELLGRIDVWDAYRLVDSLNPNWASVDKMLRHSAAVNYYLSKGITLPRCSIGGWK